MRMMTPSVVPLLPPLYISAKVPSVEVPEQEY